MDDDEAAKRKRTKKKKGKTKKEGTFLADFTEARAQPAPVQESFGGIYGPPQFLTQRENNHHGGTWHEIPLSSLSHPLLSFLEITVVISSDGRSPGQSGCSLTRRHRHRRKQRATSGWVIKERYFRSGSSLTVVYARFTPLPRTPLPGRYKFGKGIFPSASFPTKRTRRIDESGEGEQGRREGRGSSRRVVTNFQTNLRVYSP